MFIPSKVLEKRLLQLLAEDLGLGDVTSTAIIPSDVKAQAEVIAKEDGFAAGVEEALILAESLGLEAKAYILDGSVFKKGQTIIGISGFARTILAAERTMLNLLSRMSGIATTTKRLVDVLRKAGLETKVAATRKTALGLGYFDKKAVFVGGGDSHRLTLDDMLMIKDNHIRIVGDV